jgi:hypothetical protein
VGESADGQFVLASQVCDLVADFEPEPFATAIPAGLWDPDSQRPLPQRNSARHIVIHRARREVANQSRLIQFQKELLPDQAALRIDVPDPASFAAWCARRWRRAPLPDAFNDTVARALRHALEKEGNEAALGATVCWRVQFDPTGARVRLIAVYDPQFIDHADFATYIAQVMSRLDARLPREVGKVRKRSPGFVPYELSPTTSAPVDQLSVRDALLCPMISFDYLSPEPIADDADGEPATPELNEEDLV